MCTNPYTLFDGLVSNVDKPKCVVVYDGINLCKDQLLLSYSHVLSFYFV